MPILEKNYSEFKCDCPAYLAHGFGEFWDRWHISLSKWFRDYLYIPLGGNRVLKWRMQYNLLITFLISGLWHGANWTFLVWGGLHGLYLIGEKTVRFNIKFRLLGVAITFFLVCIAWIFFRANTLTDAFFILHSIFLNFSMDLSLIKAELLAVGLSKLNLIVLLLSSSILMLFDLNLVRSKGFFLSSLFYLLILVFILMFGTDGNEAFIYFQF
ncbi:MAG: hypothetical protein GY816_05690 [Cytophagales bacterium]|nr:hypothetical protein [Cytophagales bacterium]